METSADGGIFDRVYRRFDRRRDAEINTFMVHVIEETEITVYEHWEVLTYNF